MRACYCSFSPNDALGLRIIALRIDPKGQRDAPLTGDSQSQWEPVRSVPKRQASQASFAAACPLCTTTRSEEDTSEIPSLMRSSYTVLRLTNKKWTTAQACSKTIT